MAQIFGRNSNTFFRLAIVLGAATVAGTLVLIAAFHRSPYWTRQHVPPEQPVPFSHKHHVDQLGIDCRYCHVSVENSAFAGIPSAKTCMTCHSQMWTNADVLKPVRDAYETGKPIPWNKVHVLPHFVYFNHSIHVAKGVACTTCHGPVDKMEMVSQHASLWMSWCLDCHRHPEKFVGAKAAVFKSDWLDGRNQDLNRHIQLANAELPPADRSRTPEEIRALLVQHRKIPNANRMTECYVCHR